MEATYILTNQQSSINLNQADWQQFMAAIRGKVAIRLDAGLGEGLDTAIELLQDINPMLTLFLKVNEGNFRVTLSPAA